MGEDRDFSNVDTVYYCSSAKVLKTKMGCDHKGEIFVDLHLKDSFGNEFHCSSKYFSIEPFDMSIKA